MQNQNPKIDLTSQKTLLCHSVRAIVGFYTSEQPPTFLTGGANALKWIQSRNTLEPDNLSLLRHRTLYPGGLVSHHKGFPLHHDPPWHMEMIAVCQPHCSTG